VSFGAFVFFPDNHPQDRRRTRGVWRWRRWLLLLLERQLVEAAAHVLQVEVAVDLRGQRGVGVPHHLLHDRE
jgi:hypothetical protein